MKKNYSFVAFLLLLFQFLLSHHQLHAQFTTSELNGYTLTNGTSLQFGPDGRLYVTQQDGFIKVFTIQRNGANNYQAVKTEIISLINQMPNYNDDGSTSATTGRQVTGIWVEGTAAKPVIYVSSSDPRIGGPSGDKGLDTNSGIITRLTWKAASTPANTDFATQNNSDLWDKVDLVRGLPRSEENHASNGLQVATIGGKKYLFICSGGNTNAGSPSRNFTKITEYALSSAVLSVDLTVIEAMTVLGSGTNKYIYNIPTVDDPRRNNANGINNPAMGGYNGIDSNDPFGGDDGLNQGKIVQGGPVQIFTPGYRNTYDLVITKAGRMYVSDNGANGGWGGPPTNEGPAVNGQSLVTNNYHYILDASGNAVEPGGDPGTSYNGQLVNNKDNLHLVTGKGTNTISNYVFGSYYAGHPVPIRANPTGAGLYTHEGSNSDFNGYFRTSYTGNASTSLPYDWPPVPAAMADSRQGDFRNPGTNISIGEDGALLTWSNNTNALTEYTASNLSGAYKGNILAGHSNGFLHRVELNNDGSLKQLTQNFASPGGTCLGLTAQGDDEIFPGTIWVATHGGQIKVMEPQDYDGGGSTVCLQPNQAGYNALADYDNDGYSNQDEISNNTGHCASSIFPPDFDKDFISDLNDTDDDNDGIADYLDPFQMGIPFNLPFKNELFSDKMPGFKGLGLTGLMTNLKSTDNYLNWMDKPGDGNGVDDIYGGAVGAMTVYMTAGTAYGATNTQAKAFQFGVNMDQSKGPVTVRSRMLAPYHAHTTGQSQGIFIGNGDQDNYLSVNLVTNGYEVIKEVAGVAQKTFYGLARPSTSLDIYFNINPMNATVQPKISINGAALVSLGSPIAVTGALLTAIQQPNTPMAVGLIGTNGGTTEFPVNVDYFYVEGATPYITQPFENISRFVGDPNYNINLADYFDDDNGSAQLTFSIQQNTVGGINPSILGATLTIPGSSQAASGILKIRATDADNNFVEQNLSITISSQATVLFRVNAGGPAITALDSGKPNWTVDNAATPSAYHNTGSSVSTFNGTTLHQSVDGTVVPLSLFTTERYDGSAAPEMLWTFPVGQPGTYEVRLYMRDGYTGTSTPGSRVFSVKIEGQSIPSLTNIDLSGTYGPQVGVMLKAQVQSDANLQIEFIHGVENPLINGIEILRVVNNSGNTPPVITAIPNQTNSVGDQPDIAVIATDAEDNLTYSISGQPAGLSIEPTNGHIMGIITAGAAANSPFTVTVTVTDQINPPVSTTFSWTVTLPVQNSGTGQWVSLQTGTCVIASSTTPGSCPQGRHETSYVQVGDKFYLIGGRENSSNVNMYDPITKQWTVKSSAPLLIHHIQAVVYDGLIYIIGALTGNYPGEQPVPNVYIYNPLSDKWIEGPEIPRKRGAAASVLYNGKIYLVSGQTSGHAGGQVSWVDEFNPVTNTWRQLADMPNSRDHFHATIVNGKMYAIAGRKTDYLSAAGVFGNTVGQVDVFNFATETWSTLSASSNIPTQRAGASSAYLGNEILVFGGEAPSTVSLTKAEAFNPSTQTWRTVANMLTGRHSTAAIINNNVAYLAGGSPVKGSGLNYSQEAFYFNNLNPLQLAAISQSSLSGPAEVDMGSVANGVTTTKTFLITNSGSSQAIQVSSLNVSGNGFQVSLPTGHTLPVLIKPGTSLNLTVTYNSNGTANASGQVSVTHSGQNTAVTIPLKANTGTSTGYSLATNISGNGSVTKSPEKASYTSGESVQLTATPASGWQFTGWSGSASGTTNPLTLTMDANKFVTASFVQLPVNGNVVLFRVNAGGPAITALDAGKPNWTIDNAATPSVYHNTGSSVSTFNGTSLHQSVDGSVVPLSLFTTERYDGSAAPEMLWTFPVGQAGTYEVRLYMRDGYTGTSSPGSRVFSVKIEGQSIPSLTNIDLSGTYGPLVGVMLTAQVQSDENLQIEFIHGVENPLINGIEIIRVLNGAYSLTTNISGSGSIIRSPNKATYTSGESVQLTATPASGWQFTGWSGNASGTVNPISVIMDANKSINANFIQLTGGQQVVSFTLINAVTDQDIGTIVNGGTVNISGLNGLNIRANTNPGAVGSVVMNLSGATASNRTETAAPYALFGDNNGNYNSSNLNLGNHTLTGTPYTLGGGNGTAGSLLTINFTVVNDVTKSALSRISGDENEKQVEKPEVHLYPNPIKDVLQIIVNAPINTKISVSIMDVMGRTQGNYQISPSQNGEVNLIDTSQLPGGIYFLKVYIEDGSFVKDFKIMKH